MSIYIIYILFFILLIIGFIICIINDRNKYLKEKEEKEELKFQQHKLEEQVYLISKRTEERKKKLAEEKKLIEQWKLHQRIKHGNLLNSKEFNDNFDIKLRELKKKPDEIKTNSYEENFKNYLENIKLNPSNSLFRRNNLNNIEYLYLFDYLSNYTFNTLKNNIKTYSDIRNLIFNFKNGKFNNNLPIILSYSILNSYFEIFNNENYYICVIPASNINNNTIRYEKLLKILSKQLLINNGFDLIRRDYSIERSLQNGVKTNINVLEAITFSEKLKGKNIILLDDVITKGNSLINFNNKLMELGVKRVIPIFIGGTYYPIKKTLEDVDHIFNENNISLLYQSLNEIDNIIKVKKDNDRN